MARLRCGMRIRRLSFTSLPFAACLVVAALAAGIGAELHAQDVNGYQLPPSSSATTRPQGPVDAAAPPPRAVPSATAPVVEIPAPVATPSAAPTVRPSATPTPRPTARSVPEAAPAATGGAAPAPEATTPVPSAPPPVQVPSGPAVEASPLPTFAAETAAPAESTAADQSGDPSGWLWGLVGLLLAGTIGGGLFVLHRRRSEAAPEAAFVPPVVRAREPEEQAEAAPEAFDHAPVAPLVLPLIDLELQSARLSASLVNATLSYRVALRAGDALGDLVLHGEMTSAHASRPATEQFSHGQAPVLHRLDALAAGGEHIVSGDIRLPLAAITPIRHGAAALFVPLVRFEISATCDGKPVTVRRAFVVGLDDGARDARLQPFRLDHGPRVYAEVAARPLVMPEFA